MSRLHFAATFVFVRTRAQNESCSQTHREGGGLVAQLSSILAPSHLVIKSVTDQPQDISQTNLTPITNEVFLMKEWFDVVVNMFICCLPQELGEKIDTTLVFTLHKASRSKKMVSLG